jgi:hypothetical protein
MSDFDEDQLSRTLHQHSHEVGGHPIGLDQVKRSARRIQRRRRAAGGVVAAVVLAVAVPAGISLSGTSTRGTGPVGQPTVTPSATASSAPSPSPTTSPTTSGTASPVPPTGDTVSVLPGQLPTGKPPAVPWLEGRTLHHDGTTDQLPASYSDVAGYRGGWLAVQDTNQGHQLVRIDASGMETGRAPGGVRIVASADGTQLAWVEDGVLHRGLPSGHSETEDTVPVPAGYDAQVVGFGPGGEVVYNLLGTTAKNAGDQTVHATDFTHDRVVPGLVWALSTDEGTGLVAGQTSTDPDTGSGCYAVLTSSGQQLWADCRFSVEKLSPSGDFVSGQVSGCDSEFGCGELVVRRAADGEPVVHFAAPTSSRGVSFGTVAWEDDEHLLTPAYSQGRWWILRLGLDGSAQVAVGPVQGVDYQPPFWLLSR